MPPEAEAEAVPVPDLREGEPQLARRPDAHKLTMDNFRYSHQPVIATCIKEYTKESDRSIARHAASISDKKLICSKFLIVT